MRFQPTKEVVLVVTALIVGLSTGIGAVVFRYLIRGVSWLGFVWTPSVTSELGKAYVVFVPALGGLLVGLMVYHLAREAKGHGVPEVMEAVALEGGRIRPVVALVKSLASSLCIGSGGSVGREGPIVQIGSALGSTLSQALRLSEGMTRTMVACGSAGGIAATFNAPIAGVIFALEIILGQFSVRDFSALVISAVAASVVGQAVFGDVPAFPLPMKYQINSAWEFLLFPLLGVLAALVGVLFVRMLYWSEDLFGKWRSVPEWFQPAVGGSLLGILALAYPLVTGITWDLQPQIYNVGYDVIGLAVSNQLLLGAVSALLLLKLIATSLTLGSGGSGGIFAPSLFMGAMLGTAFGLVVNSLFPAVTAPPGAYALVGMAAVFAAAAHAPMTAVLILFELTGDYRIILPLMLTVVLATLLAGLMLKSESIYTLKLTRRGIHLQSATDIDVMEGVLVGEVMTDKIDTVNRETTTRQLAETANRTRHHGFPVLEKDGSLWGIVTVSDLEASLARNMPDTTRVDRIGTHGDRLLVSHPDESMGVALARMSKRGLGRLPVVARENSKQLLGLIRRNDIVRAYQLALTRRSETQHREDQARMRNIDGTQFIEFGLGADDLAVGKSLTDLGPKLPKGCVLVSIRQDGTVIIPHGDTVFRAGDRVTAFALSDFAEDLIQAFRGKDK